jgi:Ras-related protein Rab-11A
VASSYYRGAVGALVVYDITNQNSFINVDNWITELREKGPPGLIIIAVGNKSDLSDEFRMVSVEDAEKYA